MTPSTRPQDLNELKEISNIGEEHAGDTIKLQWIEK